eukprot:CAMPEP_0197573348 /NCGR_PEP_ID=MMETSP1320-20131121/42923_1 /TAXON_ID=91990 /ORGANISM="Bolidomonas sp., Strain RCC2347" /LENGTH=87 /DNA_ID=CAMNT_0043135863 /DNA_START=71 /DNA_END=334 /DNA_ORIENTATION=-
MVTFWGVFGRPTLPSRLDLARRVPRACLFFSSSSSSTVRTPLEVLGRSISSIASSAPFAMASITSPDDLGRATFSSPGGAKGTLDDI